MSTAMLLSRCDAFTEFGIWPKQVRMNPKAWLSNFLPEEQKYAEVLLANFIYYPADFVNHCVSQSIHELSRIITAKIPTLAEARHVWRTFLSNAFMCRVTGEQPNDTDSGYLMVRLIRQHASIPQSNVLGPEDLLRVLRSTREQAVVFADDIVGSGDQFISSWQREYPSASGPLSFKSIACSSLGHLFFYAPIVATQYGIDRILTACPEVNIQPTCVLGNEYNCLHRDCTFWPSALRTTAPQVILQASQRAGIPATKWQGHHDLAMPFALEHCTPDVTLPLFYWNSNGWRPLIRRS